MAYGQNEPSCDPLMRIFMGNVGSKALFTQRHFARKVAEN